MNENLIKARQEYQRKVASGEIERSKARTPEEKWNDKKSLRNSVTLFCFQCIGGIKKDVTECTAINCPLFCVRPWQKKEK